MRRLTLLCLLCAPYAAAQGKGPHEEKKAPRIPEPPRPPSTEEALVAQPRAAAWTPSERVGLPKGAQVALIGQDPVTTGNTVYLKCPAGWKMPAHWHHHTEYTTMISGKATMVVDGKTTVLQPGAYVVTPGKAKHEVTCDEESLFVARWSGPADRNWVSPPK